MINLRLTSSSRLVPGVLLAPVLVVRIVLVAVFVAWQAGPAAGQVETTAHNLAAQGAGGGRPPNPCESCHTPHNANPTRALWNRTLPGSSYKTYESTTLKATPNQPTGSSRLCLSCHDGTIAMDDRADRPRVRMMGAIRGRASLGTDLSDDHPVSFTYDPALALAKGELVDPTLLPAGTRLDEARQLQCTTCHDPHEARNAKFLVMDNRSSQLCVVCHQMRGWPSSIHAVSPAAWKGIGIDPWGPNGFRTVAENGCANCHRVHSAGRPQWLLQFASEAKNCLVCHNGTTAAKDVEREFRKFSAHPVEQAEWVHTPNEDPRVMTRHVSCSDCHNPHVIQAARSGSAPVPGSIPATGSASLTGSASMSGAGSVTGSLSGVRGINASGSLVAQASFEYEVCYACHGIKEQLRSAVMRSDNITNTRQKFDPANASYHPVVAPGRTASITGFEPGVTSSSVIRCTDCHNSDGSSLVAGPHGSRYEPILEREYDLQDPSLESYQAYALCYKCHTRVALFSDRDGFPHRKHVIELETPCSTCHDAHGSRNSLHLINFMIRGKTGNPVVSPSRSGRMEFQATGQSEGLCYLSCHGSDHDPKRYPASSPTSSITSPSSVRIPRRR